MIAKTCRSRGSNDRCRKVSWKVAVGIALIPDGLTRGEFVAEVRAVVKGSRKNWTPVERGLLDYFDKDISDIIYSTVEEN